MARLGVLLAVLALVATGCFGAEATPRPAAPHERPVAYLLPHPFPNLTVEIDYAEGWAPSGFVHDAILDAVRAVVAKRHVEASIGTAVGAPGAGSDHVWTVPELQRVAARSVDLRAPDAYGSGDRAVLHVLFLHGTYAPDGDPVSGVAIGKTAFVFPWGGRLSDVPLAGASAREYRDRSVAIHEVGHVLGLVNHGVPMVRDHEDPASPGHSKNPRSVMHAQIDEFSSYSALLDPDDAPPHEFDADDLADLRAFVEAHRAR